MTLSAEKNYNPYDFIWTLTYIFGSIFVVGPLLVPRGPDRALYRISIMQAALYMYIAWVTIYSSQIHPIQGPTFKNTTLAWLSYTWGNAGGMKPMQLPTTTTSTTTTTTTTVTTTTTTQMPTRTFWHLKTKLNHSRAFRLTHATGDPYSTFLEFSVASHEASSIIISQSFGQTVEELAPGYEVLFPIQDYAHIYELSKSNGSVLVYKSHNAAWVRHRYYNRYFIKCDNGTFSFGWKSSTYKTLIHSESPPRLQCKYVTFGTPTRTSDDIQTWWHLHKGISVVDIKRSDDTINMDEIDENGATEQTEENRDASSSLRLYEKTAEPGDGHMSDGDGKKIIAKGYYILHAIQKEPLRFSVLITDEIYKEFYVLLSEKRTMFEPHYLIHIGVYGGKTCLITKNFDLVYRTDCNLEWRENTYLKFWIWYERGDISAAAGYKNPDDNGPFLSWTDSNPVSVKYYGFRSGYEENEETAIYVYN